MKHILRNTLFAAACWLAFSQQMNAQSVHTTTWVGPVEFPDGNRRVYGYAESAGDYSATSWYCIEVWAYLYRDGDHLDSVFSSNNCDPNLVAHAQLSVPDDRPDAEYVIDAALTVAPYYTGLEADYYNYQSYLDPFSYDYFSFGSNSFLGPGPPRPNIGAMLLGVVYNYFQQGNPPGRCNDDRDTIIRQYVTHQVNLRPVCNDFTNSAHTVHFTFAELNVHNIYNWAILRDDLLNGVEDVRSENGNTPLNVNSAYRTPARNASPGVGGARQSRHMYGDAVDFASNQNTFQPLWDAGKRAGGCCEPLNVSGYGHVHVDWRGACPPGW